ncbi:nitroreductase [Photorhabdus luminescens subsp. luminescens]|uniref:SagB-type dehydrogenase domain-containing protein n=1 Tax=Photorhabdus luminescens TaxID=29488 RepID=A0A1G5QYW2_PHOLU|nr:SagB/ThcOx family dehydrogenase [Photorhabdus luminescens]KMW73072.1 nitroreductase [Photorhabdus luminescens subsp. luminescens]SCZ66906.1 SagB-type dehydrogenase domain-containing protein [Photorhabdus luminescens]
MNNKHDPLFFIRFIEGKTILWDYRRHIQYEIDEKHIKRIKEIVNGEQLTDSEIDQEIHESGILSSDDRDFKKWGWDCLSQIFHIGTQIVLEDGMDLSKDDSYEGYIDYCSSIVKNIPEMEYKRDGEVTPLPQASKDFLTKITLADALLNRKTSREFKEEKVSLIEVSNTLYWTFGAIHGSKRQDMENAGLLPVGYCRTSPSGGSLQASEAYLVALNVDGLLPGVYHYRSHTHELTLVTEDINGEKLGGLLCAQMFAKDLAFGVFVTSRFSKMWWKYPHSRAYRVALLDIGCLTQTFQLVTTGMQLGSWPTGYFLDREINKLLKIDEIEESVLFFLGAGPSSGSPFALNLIETAKRKTINKGAQS